MASLRTAGSSNALQEPLRRWEKAGLIALLLLVVGFGVLVEIRSAFDTNRRTDLGTYLRAGWAARSGANMYEVTDDNGWHYAYPPVFAVLMTPLADAPAGHSRDGMLPYPVTVAVWFVLSMAALFLAVHWIACAIEETAARPVGVGGRRWWHVRMLPILICLAPIGCTLSRGQVNMMVVALVAGMFLATVRGRRFRSGLWLAAAICLKIFPAFLLVFPIWRRDGRSLAGVAAGLFVGLAFIPSLVWGVTGALEVHRQMVNAVILPGLTAGGDATRDKELIEMTATDNQSIQAVIHNYQHWERQTRPPRASNETKLAHVLIGTLLTGLLLLAYGWKRNDNPVRLLILLGGLVVVMAVTSPVSHTHYFCLAVPLVMGLAARSRLAQSQRMLPDAGTLTLLSLAGICFALPMLPFWEHRREAGLSIYGCVLLWAAALGQLRRKVEVVAEAEREQPRRLTQAA